MSVHLNTAARNAGCATFAEMFDNGGEFAVYTGSQPASANDSPTGTLLGTITLPDDPFGAPASGVASKSGTWSATAGDSGTPGWGRYVSADGTLKMDVSVADDFTVSPDPVVSGSLMTITAATFTMPSGE